MKQTPAAFAILLLLATAGCGKKQAPAKSWVTVDAGGAVVVTDPPEEKPIVLCGTNPGIDILQATLDSDGRDLSIKLRLKEDPYVTYGRCTDRMFPVASIGLDLDGKVDSADVGMAGQGFEVGITVLPMASSVQGNVLSTGIFHPGQGLTDLRADYLTHSMGRASGGGYKPLLEKDAEIFRRSNTRVDGDTVTLKFPYDLIEVRSGQEIRIWIFEEQVAPPASRYLEPTASPGGTLPAATLKLR